VKGQLRPFHAASSTCQLRACCGADHDKLCPCAWRQTSAVLQGVQRTAEMLTRGAGDAQLVLRELVTVCLWAKLAASGAAPAEVAEAASAAFAACTAASASAFAVARRGHARPDAGAVQPRINACPTVVTCDGWGRSCAPYSRSTRSACGSSASRLWRELMAEGLKD